MGRELRCPLNFSWIRKAQRCIDRVYSGCDDTRTKPSRHQKSMVKVPRLLAILVVGWLGLAGPDAGGPYRPFQLKKATQSSRASLAGAPIRTLQLEAHVSHPPRGIRL
jgi:hypothetical protein